MTGARVQTSGKINLDGVTGAQTGHMPGNFTAGNAAILAIGVASQGADLAPGSVVINGVTASMVQAGTTAGPLFGYDGYCQIWLAENLPGGSDAFTITFATAAAYSTLAVEEWSGMPTSGAFDVGAAGSSGATLTPSATTPTLSQADELIVALFSDLTGDTIAITPPAGWTAIWTELDGTQHNTGNADSLIVAATTAVTATWGISDASGAQPVSSAIAAFKFAGAASAFNDAFSASPVPRAWRRARVDNWDPLPDVPASRIAWGFSAGTTLPPERARVADWTPIAALVVAALGAPVATPAPLPSKRERARVADWEPIPSLAVDTTSIGWGFSDGESSEPKRAHVDAWSPLGTLNQSAVFSASPLAPPRRRSAPVSDWTAPPLLTPTSSALSVDCAPAPPAKLRRAQVNDWNPLGTLNQSAVFSESPLAPRRRSAPVSDWTAPALLLPTASALGVDCAPAPPAKLRRALVNDWNPLPDLPPTVIGWGFSAGTTLPPERARVPDWSPIAGLGVVTLGPAVEPQAPVPPRARRAPVEALEPLPALPAVAALGPAPEPAPPLAPRRARQAPDNYDPLPAAGAPPSAPSSPPTASRRPRRPEPGWEPLAALTASTGAVFSAPAVTPRRRPPAVQASSPLGPIVLPPSLPSGYECGSPLPVRSHRARVPENWTPLPDLIPPVPQTNQPFLLAAMA